MLSNRVAVFCSCVAILLGAGCSNPEKKILGVWTGSGEVKMPSTGNAAIDAQLNSKGPQTLGCNLDLKEDKSYVESLPGFQIVGTWILSDNTITLTPRTVNGRGVEAAKKQMQQMEAQANMSLDLPGLSGAEQATVDSEGKSVTVKVFDSPITLQRVVDAGTS